MKKIASLLSILSLGLLMALPSGAFAAESASAGSISGTVKIAPALQEKISPTAALYIIARPDGVTSGPPVAAKRITAPLKFPVHFVISSADAMMPGTSFQGKFTLMARIAQSGSASPAAAGDLQTSKPLNGVKPGKKSVTLTIDEERK
jgi:hypothetical protein